MTGLIPHVAVIGAGQLGSRHLQGLAKISQDIKITVIDPNSDSLELARERFTEMPSNPHVQSVNYHQVISRLVGEVDLVIIATNSNVRRRVIETLLNKVHVKYLILEKVVFQSVKDFEEIIPVLSEKGIKTWVNCGRRMFTYFRELRKESIHSDAVSLKVQGSGWGMACNTVHILDLLAFLTGQRDFTVDVANLDLEIYDSKRKGFIELGGSLFAKSKRGDTLELIDDGRQEITFQMLIQFEDKYIEVDQFAGLVREYTQHSEHQPQEKPFHVPMQSELSAIQVEEILQTRESQLTSLEESFWLHRPMLNAFNQHLSNVMQKPFTICPIT
jgi:predicted dehydrogenase